MSDHASRERRHHPSKLSKSDPVRNLYRSAPSRDETQTLTAEAEPSRAVRHGGDGAGSDARSDAASGRAAPERRGRDRRSPGASALPPAAKRAEKKPALTKGEGDAGRGVLTKRQRRRRRKNGSRDGKAGEKAAIGEAGEPVPKTRSSDGGTDTSGKQDTRANEPGPAKQGAGRRSRRRRSKRRAIVKAALVDGVTPAVAPNRAGSGAVPVSGRARTAVGEGDARGRAFARSSAPFERPPVYAALDLGTNNCRLLIAIPTRPGQFRVIDAFSRIVRLGEGLSRTGSLSRGAMDRAIAALSVCAQKLSARDVAHCRLIATEACRQAANGAEFIEEVAEATGLSLEIVSRETEARLAVSGCGSLIDRDAKGAVLFDIGGGSSEIALLDLRGQGTRNLSSRIVGWTSLPVGVVTLAEKHGGRDVTPAIFEAMVKDSTDLIERFEGRDRLGALVGSKRFHLLGTSGTVTTLAGVHLELERYDRRQVDGLWLTSQEADALVSKIAGWSFAERVANPCIGSDRADLVLAGCAILQAIRRVWPAESLRVADRGLREGLLTEMMVANGAWRRNERRGAHRA